MLGKKHYANGQRVYELSGDTLTYFYRNGKMKAEGLYVNNLMEGEWKFYKITGQLWKMGSYKNGRKCGPFVQYDRGYKIEYEKDIEMESQ